MQQIPSGSAAWSVDFRAFHHAAQICGSLRNSGCTSCDTWHHMLLCKCEGRRFLLTALTHVSIFKLGSPPTSSPPPEKKTRQICTATNLLELVPHQKGHRADPTPADPSFVPPLTLFCGVSKQLCLHLVLRPRRSCRARPHLARPRAQRRNAMAREILRIQSYSKKLQAADGRLSHTDASDKNSTTIQKFQNSRTYAEHCQYYWQVWAHMMKHPSLAQRVKSRENTVGCKHPPSRRPHSLQACTSHTLGTSVTPLGL